MIEDLHHSSKNPPATRIFLPINWFHFLFYTEDAPATLDDVRRKSQPDEQMDDEETTQTQKPTVAPER